jgi:hypothetical protein
MPRVSPGPKPLERNAPRGPPPERMVPLQAWFDHIEGVIVRLKEVTTACAALESPGPEFLIKRGSFLLGWEDKRPPGVACGC